MTAAVPLIAHVIHRLDVGGLENGLVNLLNHLPRERFRHVIICLDDFSSSFRRRIERDDVDVYALNKRAGADLGMHWRLWRLLRRLRPDVLHTRNLGSLECQFVGFLAGVRCRVHGEHGWDIVDLHGQRRRYRWLRRASRVVVQRYVVMSRHLATWLGESSGVPARRVAQVYNGVDSAKFRPGPSGALPSDFAPRGTVVIGTVGRLSPVKDQLTLVRAFIELVSDPRERARSRLVVVGDGPLYAQVAAAIDAAGLADVCWLPRSRDDVADVMRALDVFVLPSLNEGISNTILEAMATGLPVVATAVGGNVELVVDGETGLLCQAQDSTAMAAALRRYLDDAVLRSAHGTRGRERVLAHFTIARMVERYAALYDELLTAAQTSQSERELA